MDSINKINRLNKIPHLLNKKREAERDKESKQQKQESDSEEDSYFSLEQKDGFKKKPPVTALVKVEPSPVEKKRSVKDGVGNYIDLTI
ncbi:MAG: hypothetical protein EA360_06610 [Balneolaceae bacterium]|nr:MAG: hypothetical protein EA360_06610 [Balneolaceae bacterium]